MSNSIFEEIRFIIFLIILGGAVVSIGIVLQSGLIVLFGGIIAGALPLMGLIMSLLERV